MDRIGPTGKVSKKRVHLLRWATFPGRTGLNFGLMDRAPIVNKDVIWSTSFAFSQNSAAELGVVSLQSGYGWVVSFTYGCRQWQPEG